MGGGAGAAGFGGFGDINDIFEDLFGFGGGRGGGGKQGPRRGADLRYDMEISFEEAIFGCHKEVTLSRQETCPSCKGSGAEPGTTPKRCTQCNGSGQVRRRSSRSLARSSPWPPARAAAVAARSSIPLA